MLKLVEGIIQRALIGIDLGQEAVVLQIIVVLGIGDIEVVNIKKGSSGKCRGLFMKEEQT